MRLTTFIEQNRERIIREWVRFASAEIDSTEGMSETERRDHAEMLLEAVVRDMETRQTKTEQADKAQGLTEGGELAEVGQKHASQRLGAGFDLPQLVSEYRALRASILRLWAKEHGEEHVEMTRFNEAIDESLTASVVRYTEMLEHTRDKFLAILGHDLRNPLHAIGMGAEVLTTPAGGDAETRAKVAARIRSSAERMNRMVKDLIDLTRTSLGDGIPVAPKAMDLTAVCESVVEELDASRPDAHVRFEARGDLTGTWDEDRLTQVVSNLVANALQHGRERSEVRVLAEGRDDTVVLEVHNEGTPIPKSALKQIFEPMVRDANDGDRNPSGLGLGLYIAREVVRAHGGTIGVTSSAEDGTTFSVELPRRPHA